MTDKKQARIQKLQNDVLALVGRIRDLAKSKLTVDANKAHNFGLRVSVLEAQIKALKEKKETPKLQYPPMYAELKEANKKLRDTIKANTAKLKEIRNSVKTGK